jgi:NADPH-dependent 2,4-dienoyl-CoA reductase/sulfur reductase-like enzyme
VHYLRTVDDARRIRSAMDSAMDTASRVLVVGAGFIGSEIAAAARGRGLPVTMVELLAAPLVHAVGEQVGQICATLHHRGGTDLRCGVGVASVDAGAVRRVVLSDGAVLPADLVVVGAGATPVTNWLDGSGVQVAGAGGGVVCDERLWTGVPGVYAAGDVARWRHPVFGRHLRVEHWTNAAQQGLAAGRNAADPQGATPYAAVPYFWSDWYGQRIQSIGLPAADDVQLVDGDPDGNYLVALYRDGDRLSGVLTINGPAEVMRYRALIMRAGSWRDGLDLATARRASRLATA